MRWLHLRHALMGQELTKAVAGATGGVAEYLTLFMPCAWPKTLPSFTVTEGPASFRLLLSAGSPSFTPPFLVTHLVPSLSDPCPYSPDFPYDCPVHKNTLFALSFGVLAPVFTASRNVV